MNKIDVVVFTLNKQHDTFNSFYEANKIEMHQQISKILNELGYTQYNPKYCDIYNIAYNIAKKSYYAGFKNGVRETKEGYNDKLNQMIQ